MKLPEGGHIENSEGHTGRPNIREKAKWCDYSGPVGEGWDGIAFMDHPGNVEHPGFFGGLAVGPQMSVVHRPGELSPDDRFRLRFRIHVHEGKTHEAEVAARYDDYTQAIEVEGL